MIPLVELLQLKKYFSGISSIRWAYEKYTQGISFQELVRNEAYQKEHNEIILGGKPLMFKTKLPRTNVQVEDIKVKRVSIKIGEQSFSADKVWKSLIDKIPDWIGTNPYIINLHSEIGETAIQAGSFLVEHIQKVKKEQGTKFKTSITSGSEVDYTFKDFNEYDSQVSCIANTDLLVIFSYNSLSSSDFNKAKFQALLDECNLKNTVVILTSKTEVKFSGIKCLNIPLSDTIKNETALIKDLGL